MIHYTKDDILEMGLGHRANLFNSITGFKPGNLVGTKALNGDTNLAIFGSVVLLGVKPALVAFVFRPFDGERHTFDNIVNTGYFTINHINTGLIEKAHYTSADYPKGVSEFDKCKLTPHYQSDFYAPFVAESRIKLGLSLAEYHHLKINNTIMVIGNVEHILINDKNYLRPDNSIDPVAADSVCVTGLDTYYQCTKLATFGGATVDNIPDFQ